MSYSIVKTCALSGIDSYMVDVEVDASGGLPSFEMVGMLNSEVKEAKERVRVALKNSGIYIPPLKITVNISPANVRKCGTAFDLPIAIALLVATGYISEEKTKDTAFLGELGLNGEIRPVDGVLPIVMKAAENGIKRIVTPTENAFEGSFLENIDVVGIPTLPEVIEYINASDELKNELFVPSRIVEKNLLPEEPMCNEPDFEDVRGQLGMRRAAEVSAAGFHHLLMIGPPGAGKTMIAKRIPSILPPLSFEESVEVSKIYSVSGLLKGNGSLVRKRPFRNPHHTISEQALAGGGRIPKPGVVSLSHKGVLFLDEAVHFSHAALEVLRQPMEDKKVEIARSYGTFTYPADFMLVAAINPCPCGYYPDRNRCNCTPAQIKKYLSAISGPILDRIDICIEAPRINIEELSYSEEKGESSEEIRKRIEKARIRQEKRFEGLDIRFNAEMNSALTEEYCKLGPNEKNFMEKAFKSLSLSARAYHKILRVARTIADLDDSEEIREKHLSEAICYRSVDRTYW